MAEYQVRFDETHLIATLARFRQRSRWHAWRRWVRWPLLLGVAVLLIVTSREGWVRSLAVLGVIAALMFLQPRIERWAMMRRFRSSPYYGSDIQMAVTPGGFASVDAKSRLDLSWSAFTRANRFPDGFLVFSGPHQFYWWPDAALRTGSVGEVEALLREHVKDYRGP